MALKEFEQPEIIDEKHGSRNFVKERRAYQFDKQRYDTVRERIAQYAKKAKQLYTHQ